MPLGQPPRAEAKERLPVLWSEKLASYAASDCAMFDAAFLGRWGDEEWKPDKADKQAAAELHVQLVSRITTQRLGYSDGDEATALTSVYQLFDRAREIVTRNATCRHVDALTWHVMNIHVRPFTAKWHPLSKRGALDALDATDIFRTTLAAVQRILTRFDDLLLDIRDDKAPCRRPDDAIDAKQAAIAEEMKSELKWGISETLGGLDKNTTKEINDAERKSVSDRREHYRVNVNSEHAIGLALSGGGIRSATFSLGVLAALARRNILYQVDYLSTVSGGGYLGSFLTTFLNFQRSASTNEPPLEDDDDQSGAITADPSASASAGAAGADGGAAATADTGPTPIAQQTAATPDAAPEVGLRTDELPFRRHEGEAQALRHLRHYSKYLASGSAMQRITMTSAMLYGMVLNLLGLVFVAAIFALLELGLRSVPGIDFALYVVTIVTVVILMGTWIVIPLWLRLDRSAQALADSFIAWPAIILIALLAWQLLGYLHLMYSGSTILTVGSFRVAGLALIFASAAVPLIASATVGLFGNLSTPLRLALTVVASVAAPLFLGATEMVAYDWLDQLSAPHLTMAIIFLALAALVFFFCLDVNFTSPHRHYRRKLGEAYLIQPNDNPDRSEPFATDISLLLSQASEGKRCPYHLINCALNVPGSRNQAMQGRLTDFFLFSPAFSGSPITGYAPTKTWEQLDKHLDVGTAMAISGAAVAPQMGLSTIERLRFWLVILNARLSYWLRNPNKQARLAYPPGLYHLLLEMFGAMDENGHFLNISDGGHIENLGVYELLRRRCKYILAVDGEQDPTMTFHALTTLQRLAFIDLGVKLDIDLDDLRLNARGLTRSHFCFCRIRYPVSSRDGPQEYGYLIYLKLSLTGNEGEFIRRYRLDEPAFPHHPTTDQFFTEAQFEAYRSLGEHVGDKLFLPAIVGDLAECPKVEDWFEAIGKSMLEPIQGP